MIIPESLNIATLFPLAAMRPNRPAEPFKDVDIVEKVFDCFHSKISMLSPGSFPFSVPPGPFP